MKDTRILQILQNVKDTICKYDYYIHTSKKVIHLSNTEDKIPHLMGLQYAGRPKQYTGDFGAYAVKKEGLRCSRWKSWCRSITGQRQST